MADPFATYRGTAYLDMVDADQRVALEIWEQLLRLGEPGLVDCEHFIDTQLYLCEATAEYIYTDYTPTTVDYQRGSRPKLEAVLDAMALWDRPEFDRFLWLARFVRDLPNKHDWTPDPYAGGTEEELIEKGCVMCNEQARLMVVLCQIAGLPARYVGHHIGGHGVVEVYVDGHWGYHDIRGKFFFKPDGALAGTWDIWRDPSIIRRQPEWVTREVHPRYLRDDPYAMTEKTFFHPKECTGITNYFVADRDTFNYAHSPNEPDWQERTAGLRAKRNAVRRTFGMVHPEL